MAQLLSQPLRFGRQKDTAFPGPLSIIRKESIIDGNHRVNAWIMLKKRGLQMSAKDIDGNIAAGIITSNLIDRGQPHKDGIADKGRHGNKQA